jgi:outer membrane cobalamin receptor
MKTIFTKKVIPLLTVLSLGWLRGDAQVDSTLKGFTLKDLLNVKVVTASRTSQKLGTAPATVMVITREQIRIRGYRSLLDVMYDLPDMKVDDKIYSGIRNSFTWRGTQGSEKIVLMIDGVIVSSPSGEAMPIMENYPVHLAEQIEVVYGPASALYGANAVSGIINIITKKPGSKKSIVVEGSSMVGSHGYTNNTLFISKKIAEHASIIVSGQYSYDKGVDYSKLYDKDSMFNVASYSEGTFNTIYGPIKPGKPVRAAYEAPLKAYNIYAALNTGDFTLSIFRNQFSIPTAFGNNTSNALYNKEVLMKQSISVGSASYKKTFGDLTASTILTVSEYNLHPESNYRNLYTNMEAGYKYSTCSMVKAEEQLGYKVSDKLNLSAGIGYESYSAIPQSGDLYAPVNEDDHIHASYLGTQAYYRPEGLAAQFYFIKYRNIGSYLQGQYSPSEKIHFTIGARYDDNSRFGSSFNPRLGIVYKPSEKTTIKALYGKAFLAPTPSDSYSQYGSFQTTDSGRTYSSYFLHLPNPSLTPIKSHSLELSIRQNLTDNLIMTLNGYYSFLTGLHDFSDDNETTHLYNNMFNGIPVDYIEVFTNNNRQKNYGGSIILNGKHDIGDVQVNSFASLSYVNGVVEKGLDESLETEKDIELDFVANFMGRLGADVKAGKLTGSARLLLMGRQNISGIADSSNTILRRQTIPGYALLNIGVQYMVHKKVSLFMNITNALNQKFRNAGFNMNLDITNTELFYGQRQDPIRIATGINFSL